MGFGDPYHKHPLRLLHSPSGNCFQCDLPFPEHPECYGCEDCDYYIHKLCQDLPIKFRHPLHDQHLLTLVESPPNSSSSSNSPNLCNECQNPCLGRFSYHCTTCPFLFHLNCLFTLKLEKHEHPLIFDYEMDAFEDCKICGSNIYGFFFGCQDCGFYIHHECSLIPLEIKHHHVHKLTLRHNFPEECDQVYCDLCEDRDGEMDRTQYYYYCKDCDYIAHVNCCIAQPREEVLICERFNHSLSLNQIEDVCISETFIYERPLRPNKGKDEFDKFTHPLRRDNLKFICENGMFRCDACGELGKGSRIVSDIEGEFDIHLECFALPGKLDHESHPNHPFYLRWLDESTSRCCSICRKEMDPQLWFYFCKECDYGAHMDCVARDLLLTLRSSIKNQPDYCAIIEPDESLFKYRIADMRPPQNRLACHNEDIPMLDMEDNDLGTETDGYELTCPKCNSLIPIQVGYSTIAYWKSSFYESSITASNDQTPSELEPLGFLDEQMIGEICCSICNLIIFPPTYSCASCQIYFHKSCAELPHKILYNDTTYVLMAPPFPEGLSDCTRCESPISSWAYISPMAGLIFDVQCAAGAPLLHPTYRTYCEHNMSIFSFDNWFFSGRCPACETEIKTGTYMMCCDNGDLVFHLECGLLPLVIKHRIHQHPLELAFNLNEIDCEYICDVCEKDLNPDVWAYRCMDICGKWATSHVSCVITSKLKCHFSYDIECQTWTEEKKLEFREKEKKRGMLPHIEESSEVLED